MVFRTMAHQSWLPLCLTSGYCTSRGADSLQCFQKSGKTQRVYAVPSRNYNVRLWETDYDLALVLARAEATAGFSASLRDRQRALDSVFKKSGYDVTFKVISPIYRWYWARFFALPPVNLRIFPVDGRTYLSYLTWFRDTVGVIAGLGPVRLGFVFSRLVQGPPFVGRPRMTSFEGYVQRAVIQARTPALLCWLHGIKPARAVSFAALYGRSSKNVNDARKAFDRMTKSTDPEGSPPDWAIWPLLARVHFSEEVFDMVVHSLSEFHGEVQYLRPDPDPIRAFHRARKDCGLPPVRYVPRETNPAKNLRLVDPGRLM